MKTCAQFKITNPLVDLETFGEWLTVRWRESLYPAIISQKINATDYTVELSAENPVWIKIRNAENNTYQAIFLLDPHMYEQLGHPQKQETLLARVIDELSVALSTRNDIENLAWVET